MKNLHSIRFGRYSMFSSLALRTSRCNVPCSTHSRNIQFSTPCLRSGDLRRFRGSVGISTMFMTCFAHRSTWCWHLPRNISDCIIIRGGKIIPSLVGFTYPQPLLLILDGVWGVAVVVPRITVVARGFVFSLLVQVRPLRRLEHDPMARLAANRLLNSPSDRVGAGRDGAFELEPPPGVVLEVAVQDLVYLSEPFILFHVG